MSGDVERQGNRPPGTAGTGEGSPPKAKAKVAKRGEGEGGLKRAVAARKEAVKRSARVSEAVTLTACRKCRSVVFKGVDAPMCGIEVECDPVPLPDAMAELAAVLAGRPTYRLRKSGTIHVLDYRESWSIAGDRDRIHTVLAAHRCPGPVPALVWHQLKTALLLDKPRIQNLDADPPF